MKKVFFLFITTIVLVACNGCEPINPPEPPVKQHTITATVIGNNGTISPQKAVVDNGKNIILTIIANSDYMIDVVMVNGFSIPLTSLTYTLLGDAKYTLSNITSDQKIEVSFRKIEHYSVISTVVGGHGKISPTSLIVTEHGNVVVTLIPDTGYVINTFKVNGIVIPLTSLTYTIYDVTSDQNVEVSFKFKYEVGTPEWYLTQYVWRCISFIVIYDGWRYDFTSDLTRSMVFTFNPDETLVYVELWNNITIHSTWFFDKTTNPITLIVKGMGIDPEKVEYLNDKKMILTFVNGMEVDEYTYTNDGNLRFK